MSTNKLLVSQSMPISFADAAERVLEESGNRQPMHYRAITQRALDLKLLNTAGRTPEATMYAQILNEIQRQTERGEQPRFVKLGKGLIMLNKWRDAGPGAEIEEHNREVREKLHRQLFSMAPEQFESLIGDLLGKLGFVDVSITKPSGDGGIDVRGTLVVGDVIRTHMAVQVKRWKQNVQAPVVQQVRASLSAHEQGLIVTTSDFATGARKEAERVGASPVALMNGKQLILLLAEKEIGIKRIPKNILELKEGAEDESDSTSE